MIQWYDERPLRERIMVLACASVVVLYLAYLLLLQPLDGKNREVRREIDALRLRQKETAAQMMIVQSYKNVDPDRDNRRRLEALERESAKLQEELQAGISRLVAPKQMPDLLKELLTRQERLELLLLQNQPSEPILLANIPVNAQQSAQQNAEQNAQQRGEQEGDAVPQPMLYRHRLHMTFRGDYMALLDYLRELENLPRAMVWEEVNIVTDVYPQATVELKVYTLSLVEGWIGG
jgi:MSHA biogenesis protein MshJ